MYDDKKKKWTKAQYHENLKKNNTKRGGGGGGGRCLTTTLLLKQNCNFLQVMKWGSQIQAIHNQPKTIKQRNYDKKGKRRSWERAETKADKAIDPPSQNLKRRKE